MPQPTVFISYAREDVDRARALARFLNDSGFLPWLDVQQILPGERWDERIQQALENADFVLLCLSRRSVSKRGYLQRELKAAVDAMAEMLDSDIYVIPVLFEKCEVPRALRTLQWVELFAPGGSARLREALVEGAKRRELQLAEADPKLAPAGDPPADLSDLGGAGLLSGLSLARLFKRGRR